MATVNNPNVNILCCTSCQREINLRSKGNYSSLKMIACLINQVCVMEISECLVVTEQQLSITINSTHHSEAYYNICRGMRNWNIEPIVSMCFYFAVYCISRADYIQIHHTCLVTND